MNLTEHSLFIIDLVLNTQSHVEYCVSDQQGKLNTMYVTLIIISGAFEDLVRT